MLPGSWLLPHVSPHCCLLLHSRAEGLGARLVLPTGDEHHSSMRVPWEPQAQRLPSGSSQVRGGEVAASAEGVRGP